MLAAVTFGVDLNGFMGGLGTGLVISFVVLLLVGGAATIRRMVNG